MSHASGTPPVTHHPANTHLPGQVPIGPSHTPPLWTDQAPQRSPATAALLTAGICIGAIAVIAVFGFFALTIGLKPVTVGTILALIPLAILLIAVRWIDRWEPEPRRALAFALLWGAGVSVAIAILVQLGVEAAGMGVDETAPSYVIGAVVQAPLVEETAKGLGLLLLVHLARRNFDGPVDGVVYAAMIATGFTFTEDVLYFAGSLSDAGPQALAGVWVMRGILSPFIHTLCTSCTGLAIGYAVQRRNSAAVLPYWLLGLAGAMVLHALWNGGAYLADNFWVFYLIIQVPLFAAAVALVVGLRRHEAALTRARLAEYAAAGWFAPGEVDWLGTPLGRRRAYTWARSRPGNRLPSMKRLIKDATALAYGRQRVIRGKADANWADEEQRMLDAVTRDRAELLL